VGGTDFDPTQSGNWARSNVPGTLATAQAHIPEMVWNNSCANPLIAKAVGIDSGTLCNTPTRNNGQPNPTLVIAGGGGGLSSCASGSNNTCQGYSQPAWQSGVAGTQGFTTRAIPDVSVIANNWIICSYDTNPCDPTGGGFTGVMGTSAAAPAVAAILALLDQQLSTAAAPDGRQGLINTQLYRLAAAEYGSPQAPNAGASACSASLGSDISSHCIFYNVTAGANAMPCQVAGYDGSSSLPASTCVAPAGGANGIMEIGTTPSYLAGSGYNLATGLGSINAANLVAALAKGSAAPPSQPSPPPSQPSPPPSQPSPPSKGGGGAIDPLGVVALALLLALRRRGASALRGLG
jgi:hypothetical protein